MRAVVGRSTTT
ncbi:hypothetical protein LINPERPRIM_LOCUS30220 [Linum perenne]